MTMTQTMCLAAKIALAVLLSPVTAAPGQVPAGFVDAAAVVDGLAVDMRYFGSDNFIGTRIDGYEAPRCLLARRAAAALAQVQQDLAAQGLGLKVFDCYRPSRAVAHFVRWAQDPSDERAKAEFYPDVDKRDLFKDGYIAARSSHSRGSTVDITLVRRDDDKPAIEIDMGTPFDLFSPRSALTDKSVSSDAQAMRATLVAAMTKRGFRPYDKEWWHFTLADEPFPDTYFDFPVR